MNTDSIYLSYRTKGNTAPTGKRRVYFTCHPDDFGKYFEIISADIFRTHDCAVYYKENMSGIISEEDLNSVLGRMNLFVIPVTSKLLNENNLAADCKFPFAEKRGIPVLPIMTEKGIDTRLCSQIRQSSIHIAFQHRYNRNKLP